MDTFPTTRKRLSGRTCSYFRSLHCPAKGPAPITDCQVLAGWCQVYAVGADSLGIVAFLASY